MTESSKKLRHAARTPGRRRVIRRTGCHVIAGLLAALTPLAGGTAGARDFRVGRTEGLADLTVAYGERPVLWDVDLDVHRGEIVRIAGVVVFLFRTLFW